MARPIQATVVETRDGHVRVRVRRNCRTETIEGLHPDLRVGDRVEVRRQANNPYLVRTKAKAV